MRITLASPATCRDFAHGEPPAVGALLPTFADLGVPVILERALAKLDITTPTSIQAATLPDSLSGRDVLGRGRTGSGKTFAFLLPLVARLDEHRRQPGRYLPRSLVLAPTRELATQIADSLAPLAKEAGLSYTVVFGGVGQNPQVKALAAGVDVLIACPGRLEDLVGQGFCDLSQVEISVLDEADHMADMGFLPGVRRILAKTPKNGQRLLFSATLDRGVDVLVKQFLTNPVTHEADSAQSPVVTMTHHVFEVSKDDKMPVLLDMLAAPGRTVVFTRTKHGAKKLAKQLSAKGVAAVDLHGNLSQNARVRNLEAFGSGAVRTLVATDIAARGIHVDDVSLVIHADPPAEHKAYLHRSGRTARAGAEGVVVTLMLPEQRGDVKALLRQAGIKATPEKVTPTSAVLQQVAPGERTFASPDEVAKALPAAPTQQPSRRAGGSRSSGATTDQTSAPRGAGGRKPNGRSAGSRGANGQSANGRGAKGQSANGRGDKGGTVTGERSANRSSSRSGASSRGNAGGAASRTLGGRGANSSRSGAASGGAAAFSAGSRLGRR